MPKPKTSGKPAKATKATKAPQAARAKSPAQPRVLRSEATEAAQLQQDPTTACYEVLTPFKFRGVIVKPPAWIEMNQTEAAPYQDAGVLDTEPNEVPLGDAEMNDDDGDGDSAEVAGGESPAGDQAAGGAQ